MERTSIEFLVRYQDHYLLRRELESIPDVTVSVDDDSRVGSRHERSLRSEFTPLAVVVAYVLGKVVPPIVIAIRDVIVEHIRSKKSTVIIRRHDGTEVIVSEGIADDDSLAKVIENEVEQCLL